MKEIMKWTWCMIKNFVAWTLGIIGCAVVIPSGLVYRIGCLLIDVGEKILKTMYEVPDFSKTMEEIADA